MKLFALILGFLAGLSASSAIEAQESFFKDWRIISRDEESTYIAITENQYNKKLSFVNEAGEYYFLMGPFGRCLDSLEMNVMVSDGKNSIAVRGVCEKMEGDEKPIYFIRFNGSELDTMLGEKGVLKVAVPSEDSTFEFTAFSLLGSQASFNEAKRRKVSSLKEIK